MTRRKWAPRGASTTAPGVLLRPVVGVDIDGTLALWHEHFLWFAGEYLGREMPRSYDSSLALFRHMRVSKATYRTVKLAYRQSGLKRAVPVVPGAAEMAAAVRRADAEVWVCTTRPYLRLDNIDPDTREWLRRNGIAFDGVLFGENKWRDLAKLVGSSRVVGVAEDLPEQAGRASRAGLPTYLVNRPHNKTWTPEGVTRINGLTVLTNTLLGNIEKWKGQQ